MEAAGAAFHKSMQHLSTLKKVRDYAKSPLILALNACGSDGQRLALNIKTRAPSTNKGAMSVMHRIVAWLIEWGVSELSEVTAEIVRISIAEAIECEASKSAVTQLRAGWTHLLYFIQPSITKDGMISDMVKAHGKAAAAPPNRAEPLTGEILLLIKKLLNEKYKNEKWNVNDLNVYSFFVHAYYGCCRFSHLSHGLWEALKMESIGGRTVSTLQHCDGQKQSGADVEIQTVVSDGAPKLSELLNELAQSQDSMAPDWPYIYCYVGKSGELSNLSLPAINARIKQWTKALGHPRWHRFSSHSARRGAVTEAKRRLASDALVKHSGKWLSDGHRIYDESKRWAGAEFSALLATELEMSDRTDEMDPAEFRRRVEMAQSQSWAARDGTADSTRTVRVARPTEAAELEQPVTDKLGSDSESQLGEVLEYVRTKRAENEARMRWINQNPLTGFAYGRPGFP